MSQENKNILIVEDEAIIALELENKLTQFGYNVIGKAHSSDSAVKKAEEKKPDLIMMDINLGKGASGIETAEIIKEKMNVPIIFLTAYADEETIQNAKNASPYGYLTKPFRETELKATIEMALEKHKSFQFQDLRFHWIADKSGEGYIILDEQEKIQYANPKARALFSLPEDEIPGETFMNLAKRIYSAKPEEVWEQWPQIPPEHERLFLVNPGDSITRPLWLETEILIPDSSSELRVVRFKDVTDEIAELSVTRTVGSMVSHKLLTPMNHIVTSLALMEKKELPAETLDDFLQMAVEGSKRLNETIQDIIRYSNSNYTGFGGFFISELKTTAIKISSEMEIHEIQFAIEKEAEKKQIRFSRDAMEIILYEIMENAKKFHKESQPHILMEASNENSHTFLIRILYNGEPLNAEQLEKASMPFYQGEKFHTGEMSGSGLGLATVKSLLWSTGGDFKIYNSKNNEGVTVDLLFPILS
ncbi:MAG: response regulator [Spirochaetia bacterium]|nr:response regulator [Spirochaetia bacterium]